MRKPIRSPAHLIDFLKHEVKIGRMSRSLQPLQAGRRHDRQCRACTASSDSPFHDLKMYSEVVAGQMFDLFDAGKLVFASARRSRFR